jgi:hypothetical protein
VILAHLAGIRTEYCSNVDLTPTCEPRSDPVNETRRLAAAIEPFTAQVYFSPECHAEYVALGFAPSPATGRSGVHQPDGTAYFCSRGSLLGQVPGEVVAATFAVFNPGVVVPAVTYGWSLTDAATISAARDRGSIAQLRRILGERPDGLDRATELLTRVSESLRPEGHPLYAGLAALELPGDPLGAAWRLADMLREYRGDAHIAAWTSAGFDAVEIGLLSELYWGMRPRSYIRSRAWADEQLDAAQERLRSRGLVDGDEISEQGRTAREAIEVATDLQLRPILSGSADELTTIIQPWSDAIRAVGGYPRTVMQTLVKETS